VQTSADALGERYVLDQLIGEGAFARTYRGQDTRLARTIAVKLLRSEYATDPAFLERFHREARAAAKVDHPNVVHVYDYGGHDGAYFLVLQYVPGHDLKHQIEEQAPLPPEDAIRIAREILGGLAAIHAAGIIHRDIKPQNVLIGLDGVPRVTDFGIAYEPGGRNLLGLTSYGLTLGTPAYMAPEQAQGEPVRHATDIYSVGVVLFELLTGRMPFTAESALTMMVAHIEQLPPPPSSIQPGVPPELDDVVLRALAKVPEDRYAGAVEMERALLDALIRIRDGVPVTERSNGRMPTKVRAAIPAPADAAPTVPLPAVTPRERLPAPSAPASYKRNGQHRRRRGAGWMVPALLAAVALAVLVGALVRATGDDGNGNDNEQPAPTATMLALAANTPEPTPTRRSIIIPADPIQTPASAEEPEPTDVPEPTQTQAPPTEGPENAGGAPTIAPSDGAIQSAQPTTGGPVDAVSSGSLTLNFGPLDWSGGFQRTDASFLGRPWTAVYGAPSGTSQATISFLLENAPSGEVQLSIAGIDDEGGGDSPLSIVVNGVQIFSGPSPFPSWDGGNRSHGPWTAVAFTIPAGVLHGGENQITVSNLSPSGAVGSPPYVLLNDVSLSSE
jgi:serine/threonine-protein kinase